MGVATCQRKGAHGDNSVSGALRLQIGGGVDAYGKAAGKGGAAYLYGPLVVLWRPNSCAWITVDCYIGC